MEEAQRDERIELFNKEDIDSFPKFSPQGEDKNLFEAIKNDKLVVFYGAGVSMLAGCASWEQLAHNIINKFPLEIYSEQDKVILKEIAIDEPKKAISICYHRAKQNKKLLEDVYFNTIKLSVIPKNLNAFAAIHAKIFDLNAISYITTNIDKGIETISKIDLKGKKITDLTTLGEELGLIDKIKDGNIFYLHGTIDHIEKTIFTVDSYLNFYSKDSAVITRFLREIFSRKYSVLFIGYSLSEYEILQNIFLAAGGQSKEVDLYNHFLLAPIYSKDLAKFNIEKNYFRIFSVKAIPYFIDHESYGRLQYVLDLLRKTVRTYRPDVLSVFNDVDKV